MEVEQAVDGLSARNEGAAVHPADAPSRELVKVPLRERIRKHRELYILFIPVALVFIVFRYWEIVLGFIAVFKEMRIGQGLWESPWVGLRNFRMIFENPNVIRTIRNTVEISLLRLVFGFAPPILLAIIFHDLVWVRFKRVAQTLVYLPHFFSWVVVYGLVFSLFSTGSGLINSTLAALGLDRIEFLMSTRWFRPILIGSDIWKTMGWGSILYMAALTNVDPGLYEAAVIDGAGPVRRVIHISIPSILPVIAFVLTLTIGNILRAGGEQILIFYNEAVFEVADVIETWVVRVGLGRFQFGVGIAVGLFQSIVGLMLILVGNAVSRKATGRGIW
jgi:putative aldouronate transport system permease protein